MDLAMNTVSTDSRTRLLEATMRVVRTKGYTAATVDDICQSAGVTKGSFFHHFKGKEDLTLQAVHHWHAMAGAGFAAAPYRAIADPRLQLLAYVDFRISLLQGEV